VPEARSARAVLALFSYLFGTFEGLRSAFSLVNLEWGESSPPSAPSQHQFQESII
jgi:hypothetical protein